MLRDAHLDGVYSDYAVFGVCFVLQLPKNTLGTLRMMQWQIPNDLR